MEAHAPQSPAHGRWRAGVNAALRYPTRRGGGVILAKVSCGIPRPCRRRVFHKAFARIMLRKRHFESQYESADDANE